MDRVYTHLIYLRIRDTVIFSYVACLVFITNVYLLNRKGIKDQDVCNPDFHGRPSTIQNLQEE